MLELIRGENLFIEAILLGIILGRLRSGKLSKLEKIEFKGFKLLLGFFIVDILLRLFIVNSSSKLAMILFAYYPYTNIALYILTIIFLELNKKQPFVRIIEAGFLLNLLPMITNNGKMPVLESALIKVGKLQEVEIMRRNLMLGHQLVNSTTRFQFLADILPLNLFIPKVISLGDIVIALGIALFISSKMTRGRGFEK